MGVDDEEVARSICCLGRRRSDATERGWEVGGKEKNE